MAYATQSIEGVNFSLLYTAYDQTAAISSTNSPDNPGPQFSVGTEVVATDGSIWMFVKFGGVVAQYDVVAIDPATVTAIGILGGGAETVKKRVGFYQGATTTASSNYGWVMVSGVPTINVLGAAAKNVQLYTTDTTGKLDDAISTGSQFPIRNVYLTTTIGATASFNTAQAAWPSIGLTGSLV